MRIPLMIMYTVAAVLFIFIRSQPAISTLIADIGIAGQLLLGFFVIAVPLLFHLESRSRRDPEQLFERWKKKTERAQKRAKQIPLSDPRQG